MFENWQKLVSTRKLFILFLRIILLHHQPWFNDRLKSEIKLRRWKEKVWLHDPTEYNLQAFYNQRRFVANLAKSLEKHTTIIYYMTTSMITRRSSGLSTNSYSET